MNEMTVDQALKAAEHLNGAIGKHGVTSAYAELEKAVHAFQEGGYPLDSIIPQGQDARLGFSLKNADGKSFFEIYSSLLRKSLCGPGGEFNKLIKSGLNSSVGAVLMTIVSSLGIPAVALGIMIPIAVIIANTGLEAFCEVTRPRE